MFSKNHIRIFIFTKKILYNLKPKLKKITKKKAFFSTFQTDSKRTSRNLPNNFPILYLRLDNLSKNGAKVVVLFCPHEIYIEYLRYALKLTVISTMIKLKNVSTRQRTRPKTNAEHGKDFQALGGVRLCFVYIRQR